MATKTGWAAYPCINPSWGGKYTCDAATKKGDSVIIHPVHVNVGHFSMPDGGVFFERGKNEDGYAMETYAKAMAYCARMNKGKV